MKKKSNFYLKYIAIISLCLLLVGGFFALRALGSGSKLDVVGVDKDNPYYSLRKNATEYQKDVYKQISEAFKEEPVDQVKISGLVVQNFVSDFYTWTNKLRFNDVGGLQYLHKDIQGWVNAQALETFYGDLNYYLQNDGVENTLEVSNVSVSVEQGEFEMDEIVHTSYTVEATWTYKESSRVQVGEYQNKASFTLIADEEGLFSIVEVQDVKE